MTTTPKILALLCLLSAIHLGCKEPPQIASHRIPRSQSGLDSLRIDASEEAATDSSKGPIPDGWSQGSTNSMVYQRFSKEVDGATATVSVTPLPSQEWVPNVQRWNGQISIDLTPKEIGAQTTEVEVDGITSQRIELVNDEEGGKAIIGIMTVKGQTSWFIKLMGKKEAVLASESDFDAYVATFKIP